MCGQRRSVDVLNKRRLRCERCGREMPPGSMPWHRRACERVPLPDELYALLEKGASRDRLAERFGVSADFINKHLRLAAGEASDLPPAPRQQTAPDVARCARCSLLLDHALSQPVRDGLCVYCSEGR